MMTPLASLVTAFFRHHLAAEKGVSKHTLVSYSHAFKFLCRYVSGRLGKPPSALSLEDLDAPMVRDFLDHRERHCGNTARTRNLRLTAIRSFISSLVRWLTRRSSVRLLEIARIRRTWSSAAGTSPIPLRTRIAWKPAGLES